MPNAKVLEEKKALVAALAEKMQNASAGVLVDYKGITVADDTKFNFLFHNDDHLFLKECYLISAFNEFDA